MKEHELLNVYRLGIYHDSIFTDVKLLLGDFSISESYTELLKDLSPLKTSVLRIIGKKEGKLLCDKIDDIYNYFKRLKNGDIENDRQGKGMFNEIEDLSAEVSQKIREFAETNFEGRSKYLFNIGRILKYWDNLLEPPYRLKEETYTELLLNMKASNLIEQLAKVKELHEKSNEESFNNDKIWQIRVEIEQQLRNEDVKLYIQGDKEEIKTNPLTNLPNKEQFEDDSTSFWENPELPFTLAFLDMDNLKKLNTQIGHESADKVINELASYINYNLTDRAGLYHRSGDEFLIYFPNTNSIESKLLLERILNGLKSKIFLTDIGDICITVSCGIASYPEHAIEFEELKEKSCKAMQMAKDKGKAQVCIWDKSISK
jgi:diguanylate cyclase (GGDEF)-like protein